MKCGGFVYCLELTHNHEGYICGDYDIGGTLEHSTPTRNLALSAGMELWYSLLD